MHVLIAPDKFKGSLTAAQAAAALAKGWREGWPVDKPLEIECLPVADGGEGTAEAIHDALAGRWITLDVRDPIGRIVEGRYALIENAGGERLAVLEMSSASGFSLVRGNDREEQPDSRQVLPLRRSASRMLIQPCPHVIGLYTLEFQPAGRTKCQKGAPGHPISASCIGIAHPSSQEFQEGFRDFASGRL